MLSRTEKFFDLDLAPRLLLLLLLPPPRRPPFPLRSDSGTRPSLSSRSWRYRWPRAAALGLGSPAATSRRDGSEEGGAAAAPLPRSGKSPGMSSWRGGSRVAVGGVSPPSAAAVSAAMLRPSLVALHARWTVLAAASAE
ncbi:unnamed protein product, partial [Ectocarpus fasciculatus]